MKARKCKILAISGSLRPMSSAGAVLRIVSDLVPDNVNFKIFNGVGSIPAFDDGNQLSVPVMDFIQQLSEADAVLFCTPEYAFGVPGALKNALDWTVSTTAFSNKPVALITAATNGENAHASLTATLVALGSIISDESKLLIPFIRTKLDEKGHMKDLSIMSSIKRVINALLEVVESESKS